MLFQRSFGAFSFAINSFFKSLFFPFSSYHVTLRLGEFVGRKLNLKIWDRGGINLNAKEFDLSILLNEYEVEKRIQI